VARSPDRATASTAGLPETRIREETFGHAHVRGRETRAQHEIDLGLIELLAESIVKKKQWRAVLA
jgi:hypothetical protein